MSKYGVFSGLFFSRIRIECTELLKIQPKCGKTRTKLNPILDKFYAVLPDEATDHICSTDICLKSVFLALLFLGLR